jgi:predicted DNA-binding protein with PD1-like motif
MKHKAVRLGDAARRFVLIFDLGDDVLSEMQHFAEAQHILAATLPGIGGFRRATVAYYDMEAKRYEPNCGCQRFPAAQGPSGYRDPAGGLQR